jgi:Putative auto-transporter adhesin, head GIN domain
MRYFYFTICLLFIMNCSPFSKDNGPVKTEKRNVDPFTQIEILAPFKIEYTVSDSFSLEIEAPDKLLKEIETKTENNLLTVTMKPGKHFNPTITIRIKGKELSDIKIQGAADFELMNTLPTTAFHLDLSGASEFRGTVKTETADIELSGASTLTIDGSANEVKAEISGASSFHADHLATRVLKMDASGASNANVLCDSALDLEASGASSIRYSGKANQISKDASGASSITPY